MLTRTPPSLPPGRRPVADRRPPWRPHAPSPPSRGTGGWPAQPGRRRVDLEATAALAILTLASAAGLFRIFAGRSWVGPVAATIVVTHAALWVMRRRSLPTAVAGPAGLVVVVLMVMWTVLGQDTAYGFPGPHAWSAFSSAIARLNQDFATTIPPVPPSHGFVVLAAGGGGLVAVLGDFMAFRWRSPLIGTLPGLAAFIACCAAGAGPGRGWTVGAEVGAVCVFLLVERSAAATGQIWFAGVRSGAPGWAAGAGLAGALLALVAAVGLTPTLAGRDGVGALGWRSGAGIGGGERIVPNPIVSLQTRLLQLSNTPVFAVDSSVPSYWRLTSLDTFNGVTWTATGAYRGFDTRLPGSAPTPAGTRTVRATFQIQQLDSVWLPEQFNPVAVRGGGHVSYDPASGSLITSSPTSNGMTYTVDSVQYLDTLSPAELESAPPVGNSPALSSDLELPAAVDGSITQLAASLTAGRTSEYDKALAIQNYLRGPQFTYTLNPPAESNGSDSSALYQFLFVTRQGYCQQFAGAYAVLARAAGLPTRLAVGFSTGDPLPGGEFQVHDRDAHTWPEVYFGPRYGWLPFEPTPGFSVPGTSSYAGTSGSGNGQPTSPTTTVAPSSAGSTPAVNKGGTPTTRTHSATTSPSRNHSNGSASFPVWVGALAAVPAALVLWMGTAIGGREWLRRRRRRRAKASGPAAEILELWHEVCLDLHWAGIDGRPAETDDELAQRATTALATPAKTPGWARPGPLVAVPAAADGPIIALAGLARRAAFAPSVPPELVAGSRVLAAEIHARLFDRASTAERLRHWLVPRPGWWARSTLFLRPGERRGGGRRPGMGS